MIAKVRAFVREFPKALADVVRLLNRNRIFIDRTKRHRRISRKRTRSI